MKSCKNKTGFTLVEMLIVVAIIALLASMVIGIASRIDSQSKEELVENTFALLNAALGQFRDYGYRYKDSAYDDFDFPLDCNDFSRIDLEDTLGDALDASVEIVGGTHDTNYSGSEVLYFFLNRVPASRKTLDKIDISLITNKGSDRQPMNINVGNKDYPLLRIIDPWGETLRYDYYEEKPPPLSQADIDDMKESKRTFPVITSAGPDREFGTDDDISSR